MAHHFFNEEAAMRAVIAQNKQPVLVDIPMPSAKAGELLIKVSATALNRADLLQVQGSYPPPPDAPDTLGMELAGEVVEIGADVTGYKVRDRVMALVGGGGYAEFAIAPAEHAMRVPDNLSDEEAAAIPEAFLTAYSNMLEIGGLLAEETVLIHAGASGVGLAAIQIARHIGARVISTASVGKHQICMAHGAHQTIDYKSENFADVILADSEGVDLVIDFIGADYWDDNVRVLKKWGRLVFVGLMSGAQKEVNFGQIMRKRLTVSGSTMRDRTYERKAGLIARFWKWAEPPFRAGTLKATVWRSLPLEQVEEAHQLMQQNQNAGKIVLTL
jgi:putative PIG3 family NAD(P)H quinone oxidoreductase